MNKPLYITINIAGQILILFLLLFANTYINDTAVPDKLLWQFNKPRVDTAGMLGFAIIKFLALIVEGTILVLIIYFLNRYVCNDKAKAFKILKLGAIVTICFIIILIWGSFNGYLW